MNVRAIDGNGDWVFGTGRGAYLKDNAAVAQRVRCRLLMFLNECFFDMTSGIDWFNLLGSKDQVALNLSVTATILNTPEVSGIISLATDLNRTTRAFTIQYSVQTVYSQLSATVQLTLS